MLIFIVHISTSLCWKIDMSNFVDCEICFDTRALLLSIAVIFLWHHEFRNLIKGKGGNWLTPSHRYTSIHNNQNNNDFNYFRIVFGISIRLKFHKCNLTLTFFKRNAIFLRFVTAVMASQIKPQQVYLEKYHIIICFCIYIIQCYHLPKGFADHLLAE